jgi:hypothetical protein
MQVGLLYLINIDISDLATIDHPISAYSELINNAHVIHDPVRRVIFFSFFFEEYW